jgi:hypothetical protein
LKMDFPRSAYANPTKLKPSLTPRGPNHSPVRLLGAGQFEINFVDPWGF